MIAIAPDTQQYNNTNVRKSQGGLINNYEQIANFKRRYPRRNQVQGALLVAGRRKARHRGINIHSLDAYGDGRRNQGKGAHGDTGGGRMKPYLYLIILSLTWGMCLIIVPRVMDGVFDKLMVATAILIFALICGMFQLSNLI